jgi:ABC-type multidrug transport system ATPase subunit
MAEAALAVSEPERLFAPVQSERGAPDADVVTAQPAIVVRGLRKRYGRIEAVAGVDLEVRAGDIYGLIGPDGAGKSSLMNIVAGVLTHDAGTVDVLGVRIDSERAAERIKGRLGLMPQGLGLNLSAELSVGENIDYFARLRLVSNADLARVKTRLLRMTRLDAFRDRPMKHLSGGMKQKLGLICTLIHEPELIVLDEPTTGVDPVSRRDFWNILAELVRERGITALISTAYMDEAARFDRVALLHQGRVLAQGAPEELQGLAPGMRSEGQAASLEDVFIGLLGREAEPSPQAPPTPDRKAASPTTAHEIAIEARELVRDFGRFRAVDHVSFRVEQGEIVGLLGANGAGKTTIIKMLTGILPLTSGEGRVGGADMRRAALDIKRRIGYMSQAFSLYRDLTVEENIRLYAGIYGLSRAETAVRLSWVAELAGLQGHERAMTGSLPMGVRQRLALGCALVHRPRILFLDEPTSGVDPVGRRQFWQILFGLAREQGVAILVTTHVMSEAEQCDRLVLMYDGRVIADATPQEMEREVERVAGRLLDLLTDRPTAALSLLVGEGFATAALYGSHIHLFSHDLQADTTRIRALLAASGVCLEAVTPLPVTMEDVFVTRVTALEGRRHEP